MTAQPTTLPPDLSESVARALAEDIGNGDLTAELVAEDTMATAELMLRTDAVLSGQDWANAVFQELDSRVQLTWHYSDGDAIMAPQTVCSMTGPARAILTGERTALNFLQTLSATATVTRDYVTAIAGTSARILDTRKTVPGLRLAQKYAVRCGGGENHRLGLYDAVLIKENHIAAAGSIEAAARSAREQAAGAATEIEVETLEQLREALSADIDRIMLDNFSLESLREVVLLRDAQEGDRKELEASGGIDLLAIRVLAETGVDYISVGALTKNVAAADFSLRIL
ncbi:MAG: carboxylating nicotinate-nucleotide diphosphorylase [Candidatus Rariloculaceae bacterium]